MDVHDPISAPVPAAVRDRIRAVLLDDWDPHDAARNEAARGTYNRYIDPIYQLLLSGADEDAVIEYLHGREQESMCFPSLGTARLRRVARRLLAVGASGIERLTQATDPNRAV